MDASALLILIVLFFLTSIVGVVTGSNSLITVPVMFAFGVDEKVAIATNMFGLTFMAIGATIPFVRKRTIDYRRVSSLVVLTLIGSAIGALLVGVITNQGIKLMVSIAMIVVALFTFIEPGSKRMATTGSDASAIEEKPGGNFQPLIIGFAATFLLAIYGGLYSGGYVTILTAALVAFYGMSFGESVAATKLINVFSSGIATLVFMWQGLVDYKLGAILAMTMFAGAYAGAHFATKLNETWLRRIFLTAVFFLAIKLLIEVF
jgi:uncharacterized membrane protein YfcA